MRKPKSYIWKTSNKLFSQDVARTKQLAKQPAIQTVQIVIIQWLSTLLTKEIAEVVHKENQEKVQ